MKCRVIRMQLAEDGNQKRVGVVMMDDVYSIQVKRPVLPRSMDPYRAP